MKKNAEYQRAFRARRADSGLIDYRVWVTEEERQEIERLLSRMRGFDLIQTASFTPESLKMARGSMSINALAKALGVAPSSISRWEAGTSDISPSAAQKLTAYFKGQGIEFD